MIQTKLIKRKKVIGSCFELKSGPDDSTAFVNFCLLYKHQLKTAAAQKPQQKKVAIKIIKRA